MVLVLGWGVFWLNTAFFPCCQAFAAAIGHPSDSVSKSPSAAQLTQHSDDTHPTGADRSPLPPCHDILNSQAAMEGVSAGLTTDRTHQQWFAIDVTVAARLPAVNDPVILARSRYHPPPPFRLYLHTQRLLI